MSTKKRTAELKEERIAINRFTKPQLVEEVLYLRREQHRQHTLIKNLNKKTS